MDIASMSVGVMYGGVMSLAYGIQHLMDLEYKKEIKSAESKLQELSENYAFERGHI